MLGFIKRVFVVAVSFFICNILECVSMKNQERKIQPEITNTNSNDSLYPCSVKIDKCSGSCNNINDPYAKYVKNG